MNKVDLAGCVIIRNESILLLYRIKTDWYELPGGKVIKSEPLEDAAQREFKEELLCDIEAIQKLGQKDFEENGQIYIYHWFLAKFKDNRKQPQIGEPKKFSHYRYVPINKLSQYRLSPNIQNLLNEFTSKFRLVSNHLKCPYCGSSPKKAILLINVSPISKRGKRQKPLSTGQNIHLCTVCGSPTFSF